MNATLDPTKPMPADVVDMALDEYRSTNDFIAVTIRKHNAFKSYAPPAEQYDVHVIFAARGYGRGDDEICLIGHDNSWTRYFPKRDVLAIRAVGAGEAAQSYKVGQRVTIEKYGNVYGGVVQQVMKTRIRVRYQLKNRQTREHTFHGFAVYPPIGARHAAWEREARRRGEKF